MEETNNNLSEAKIWLKKKGFKEAENKMSRCVNTKLYGLKARGNEVFIAKLSCETDFVSGTDLFKNYLNIVLETLMSTNKHKITKEDLDNIKITNNSYDKAFDNNSLIEALKILIAKTGENCKLDLSEKYGYLDTNKYITGTYLHTSPDGNPYLGLKAAYVILEHDNNSTPNLKLKELAEKLAMQVVACNPKYLDRNDVPKEVIEHEEKIIRDAVAAEGKFNNSETIEKIVKSKINGWCEENVLNEQKFVIIDYDSSEGNVKVQNLVANYGKNSNLDNLRIKEFKLFV